VTIRAQSHRLSDPPPSRGRTSRSHLYGRGGGKNAKRPGFQGSGKILERLVDTGQTVKQGQPLLRLDPVDLKLQAQAQQRAVDAAQARARKATSDEARYRGLVASGAGVASEYDQIKAAADSARADSAQPGRRPTWRKTQRAMPYCWRIQTG
jgi:pyruvate/2-oxoglutarate dehydrogenase complex dihydrolipoamide acyltransferase (E2) component